MYVNLEGLLNFLSSRIDLGYAVPLNPKWVLCDQGWWILYRKLITSRNRWTREACNAWLPSWSGLRERLEQLHERYPRGFVPNEGSIIGGAVDQWLDPDLAEYKLERFRVLQRAKKKMRAMFFSSIAHELRTPLNSIIPMVRMILTNFLSSIDGRVKNYLNIILNSSLHLQNVIEDALDMSRIENNKFQIFKEFFDIRSAVQEVASIMEFQTTQKGLSLNISVDDVVPE
jgi:signal transduction histidine kinase